MSMKTATDVLGACKLLSVQLDCPEVSGNFTKAFVETKSNRIDWALYDNDEVKATPRARDILESILRTNGITIGRGGYKVLDVKDKLLFSNVPFDEGKLVLNGKTDIIVVPYLTHELSFCNQLRLIYDLKTPKSQHDSRAQQVGEQLVAARLSDHPVMTVFTDQNTAATISLLKGDTLAITGTLSLSQAAYMMCDFLRTASPSPTYRLPDIVEGADEQLDPLVAGARFIKQSAPSVSEVCFNELELINDIEDPLQFASEKFRVIQNHAPWMIPSAIPHDMRMFA